MSMERFRQVHKRTAKWEGGWSDHPADPGGKTMYGITQATYNAWRKQKGRPAARVRNISRAEAEEIYFHNYWMAAGCDTLHPGVDCMTYDAAVNSGVGRAREWLVASIGGSDKQTIERFYTTRMSFLKGLKTWKTFGKGWTNRVKDIYAKSLDDERRLPKLKSGAEEAKARAAAEARAAKAEADAEKAKHVVKDAAAEDRISTTEVVTTVTGIGGAATAAKEAVDAVKDGTDSLVAAGPWVLLVIVIAASALYVIRERRRKKAMARAAMA